MWKNWGIQTCPRKCGCTIMWPKSQKTPLVDGGTVLQTVLWDTVLLNPLVDRDFPDCYFWVCHFCSMLLDSWLFNRIQASTMTHRSLTVNLGNTPCSPPLGPAHNTKTWTWYKPKPISLILSSEWHFRRPEANIQADHSLMTGENSLWFAHNWKWCYLQFCWLRLAVMMWCKGKIPHSPLTDLDVPNVSVGAADRPLGHRTDTEGMSERRGATLI